MRSDGNYGNNNNNNKVLSNRVLALAIVSKNVKCERAYGKQNVTKMLVILLFDVFLANTNFKQRQGRFMSRRILFTQ